ncbi:hypothetical protein AHF37_10472 [Paragonimus kellicotti]|nr:hypothetical protein AHF37_10472 [Paragonimus kellicotti]
MNPLDQQLLLVNTMLHPLSDYYIDCAQLTIPNQVQPAPNKATTGMTELSRQQRVQGTWFVRTIRQLLLLGTRCLILDCWAYSTRDKTKEPLRTDIKTDIFVYPSVSKDLQCETNQTKTANTPVNRNNRCSTDLYVPLELALDAIKTAFFLQRTTRYYLFSDLSSSGRE